MKDGPLTIVPTSSPLANADAPLLHRLLLAYYRILKATDNTARDLSWDFSLLHQLFFAPHLDMGVRWLAIRCYVLQCGIGENVMEELERKALGEPGVCDCNISYGVDVSGTSQVVDGWLLPIIEAERIEKGRQDLLQSPAYYSDSRSSQFRLSSNDLSCVTIHFLLECVSSLNLQRFCCRCSRGSVFPHTILSCT